MLDAILGLLPERHTTFNEAIAEIVRGEYLSHGGKSYLSALGIYRPSARSATLFTPAFGGNLELGSPCRPHLRLHAPHPRRAFAVQPPDDHGEVAPPETERKCSVATRNVRLAAIRTFFRIVAANVPTAFEQCQRIIAIPMKKRPPRRPIDYLERDELEAVLTSIDRSHRGGLRDYALLALIYNCGNRIQETLDLNACDLHLERPYYVRLRGKGNKERISPLWPETAAAVRELLAKRGVAATSATPVFVSQRGERLSRDGASYLLKKHVRTASARKPTLTRKRLHPHSVRHTTAVHMRRAGDDYAAIAALLGHVHPTTTESIYGHIDLEEKRKAIEANPPPIRKVRARWRRPEVLEILTSL
jgi:site-specific recombinase XerD